MKTNPIFRATYPLSSGTSKKEKKEMARKEKVTQAIFERCHKQISSKKKLPKNKVSIQNAADSPKIFSLKKR